MARRNLLKGFKIPKAKDIKYSPESGSKKNYMKYTASPFETGFGTTVGNTLRRILLSSIPGYAITAVRITSRDANGAAHVISSEFEAIPNIEEDTLEVINNLKQVRLRLPEDTEEDTLVYEFKGPGVVMSGDLQRTGQLDVMTQDLQLFTMMDGANLEIEIQVNLNRGYVPAEVHEKYIDVVGTLPMDAIFTPVQKVKYSIEPCRVGERNDYDKLILEIWTDGSVSPEDALGQAACIAKEHFIPFINFDDRVLEDTSDADEIDPKLQELLRTPVEELELSVRSANCLRNASIKTIGELIQKTEDDIAKTRNFGKKSLTEIKEKLLEQGLTLGMTDFSSLKNYKLDKHKEDTDES